MKVTFNIQNKKAERSIIVLSVHWDGMRYQISTGQSILVSAWDDSNKRIKRNYQNAMELNRFLNNLKVNIEKKYLDEKNLGHSLDKDEMKHFIKDLISPNTQIKNVDIEEKSKQLTFLNYFDQFIAYRQKNQIVTDGTLKHYRTARKHLAAFQSATRKKLDFDIIDKNYFDEFMMFLNHKQHLNNNSAGGIIKVLKTFMNWALDNELHNNSKFIKHLKRRNSDSEMVALTMQEVELLENIELKSEKLNKTRDLFLIQIYTGMRFSDLNNLKPENFDLDNMEIRFYTIKTKDLLQVPIHGRLIKVLNKYPELNLPKISNQKYNVNLKELCKAAGIDSLEPIVDYQGTKRVEKNYPKYQLISSHTGRRTFITISLQLGVLAEEIMKITGHRTIASLQKYVKIPQETAIDSVKNAWG